MRRMGRANGGIRIKGGGRAEGGEGRALDRPLNISIQVLSELDFLSALHFTRIGEVNVISIHKTKGE